MVPANPHGWGLASHAPIIPHGALMLWDCCCVEWPPFPLPLLLVLAELWMREAPTEMDGNVGFPS